VEESKTTGKYKGKWRWMYSDGYIIFIYYDSLNSKHQTFFWNITPWRLVDMYYLFRRTCFFLLKSNSITEA